MNLNRLQAQSAVQVCVDIAVVKPLTPASIATGVAMCNNVQQVV